MAELIILIVFGIIITIYRNKEWNEKMENAENIVNSTKEFFEGERKWAHEHRKA